MKKYILFSIIVFSALWFLGSATAQAATYWVSPNGSASWTGSPNCQSTTDPGSNYCALNTANINAAAGDTVYIKAGTYTITGYNSGIAPANSGTGVGAGRIIFSRVPSEAKPLITGGSTGIELSNRSYIKIDGIKVQSSTGYSAHLETYSNHNEITNCEFSDTAIFMIRAMCGNTPETYTCNATHNWVHHNTFYNMTAGGPCEEGGDTIRLGQPWGGDGQNNYNTIEDNAFAHSGHGTIDSYGFHYAVIKNNTTRNEPWWTANGIDYLCPSGGYPDYTDNSFNNKWGHRNFQVGFTPDGSNSYSLIEGNRLGYQSPNPGNYGDSNLSIAGRGMLVRHNYSFGAMRIGMHFKYVNASANGLGGSNCRVYNNTIYRSGYGFEGGGQAATRRHGFTFDSYTSATTGNQVKNNIIYDSQDGDFGASSGSACIPYCSFTTGNAVDHNWCTSSQAGCSGYGNPLFVNPDVTTPASIATLPNLTLQSGSGAINGGVHLTTAVNSGTNSTTLIVQDALYFQDGTWGSALARGVTLFPDWIAIGTISNVVQISSINYSTNTITLASPMTWSNGAAIWLYKNSDGSIVLSGSAPDYGAYEYLGVSPPTCTYTYSTWGACQSNNTQTRTVVSSSPSGCTGTPVLTQACTYPSQAFSPEQYIQAESGTLSSMQTGISGPDTYIYTNTANQGFASYAFSIQTAGQYRMEARVLAGASDTAGANSWYVGLDGESANGVDIYAYDTPEATTFTWDNVSLRGPSGTTIFAEYDPKIWDLTQGLHAFTFYGREANAWLDQIILKRVTADTTPPAAPTGLAVV